MKIPEKIKIGGKTYKVSITKNLENGNVLNNGEINYGSQVIRIAPNAKETMEATFLHEVIHSIYDFLGYTKHDEKKIDELSNALYMVIQDNPKIFNSEVANNE